MDEQGQMQPRDFDSSERLRIAETASGIGVFSYDPGSAAFDCSAQTAALFGIDPRSADGSFSAWERSIFIDDIPKVQEAFAGAAKTGRFYVEFRLRHADGSLHWIAGKGDASSASDPLIVGAFYEITERKSLEARLLALNETLEARVNQVREEARTLEVLNTTGVAVAAEHDTERLVQMVTDAGVELSHAEFGAFFYNVLNESGESYTLYTLSGASRESFAKFPMPRNTAIFEPTFRGRGTVRSDDILRDQRYGKSAPYHGMPKGHLPVRSYLAVSVVSRSGEVLGGLFFGHAQPDVFTERAERLIEALAAQAAVAIDNAGLYQTSQREIEARRNAETELQRLNEALHERVEERARQLAAASTKLEDTERRFRLLVEGVSDYAIYMLDPGGHVINWNPGAQRIKGYTREEILGRHFSTFYDEVDRNSGFPTRALGIAAETGKFEAEGWRVRKDGSKFWAGVVINAIRDANGELVGFAKITRDLTEKRAAEERSRQAQKMEGIGQLTGGVAHDFNNLLTIIIGNLETLQKNLSASTLEPVRLRRSVDHAMRGARRAESLTQRLLAFSRQQPLDPKPVDLGRLVSGMSDMLRRTLGEQVTVETVLGGGTWKAFVDPNQLEVAIVNLAVNARDAMPEGGKLTLETANVHLDEKYTSSQVEVLPGQYVMLAVTDSGHGMPPDVVARAFDPFFTTKDIGHGTGLGLSQVYGFAKQSRGHVRIYSEVGEGTTIKLYLPRVHGTGEAEEAQDEDSVAGSPGHEMILVVEDDADVRTYSCETLRDLEYQVIEAENGQAGLRALERHPGICVLFTDVGLPGGMNGRQLADEARKRRPDLKVLFTTGYARNAIVHDGRLDAGVELITKPFSQSTLSTKLRDIIDSARSPGRILLVEDEPLIQMLAREYLEDAGFQVDTAGSATEAMNKLRLVPGGVDAVILDLGLPDKKGDELLREIRSLHGSLPVLLATGQGAAGVREQFKNEKAIAFVTKPYSDADLRAGLRKLGIHAISE
ncbi:response regulator [Bradyrhizobium sp. Leo121]|uniref:hybrid sensor histidine kinase/response regulator n=1 Tax=Bradyrhizobium sp. Leo121 TaxID=1571195 RepID=UPI00102A6BD5|nr:histidine kinase [Bradyrhizobium sp. Leo121]